MFAHGIGRSRNIGAACGLQILRHVRVVAKHAARGTNFGTHVADGGFAGGRNGVGARAKIFHDGPSAAFYGQHAGNFQDHVFGARPPRERTRQANANHFWPAHVKRETRHHVDGVGATHTNGHHAQATGVGGVAVGADHHSAGEGVVL